MNAHPYQALTPDTLIDWLESLGIETDYRIYPLNSYENRVYRVGLEGEAPIVVKVYRPGRWQGPQIQEELDLLAELAEAELPVVPALSYEGKTLLERDGFYLACFPMRAGHALELDNLDQLYRMGQLLGRVHTLGEARSYQHRPKFQLLEPINQAKALFETSPLMPEDLRQNYLDTLTALADRLTPWQQAMDEGTTFRIHGDFHAGNILSRDDQLLLVDFDDTVTGPAMQDVWKLLSGSPSEQQAQLSELMEGYEQFRDFPRHELPWAEPLRTRHMVAYTHWLASRWDDPAFPAAFPWFGQARYWSDHLLALREQWSLLDELSA